MGSASASGVDMELSEPSWPGSVFGIGSMTVSLCSLEVSTMETIDGSAQPCNNGLLRVAGQTENSPLFPREYSVFGAIKIK